MLMLVRLNNSLSKFWSCRSVTHILPWTRSLHMKAAHCNLFFCGIRYPALNQSNCTRASLLPHDPIPPHFLGTRLIISISKASPYLPATSTACHGATERIQRLVPNRPRANNIIVIQAEKNPPLVSSQNEAKTMITHQHVVSFVKRTAKHIETSKEKGNWGPGGHNSTSCEAMDEEKPWGENGIVTPRYAICVTT